MKFKQLNIYLYKTMSRIKISDKVRRLIYATDYEYFAHIPRKQGFFGFKKEYTLSFPNFCANCASEYIENTIQIGVPEINMHHSVGDVPYCKVHSHPILENKNYSRRYLIPLMIITITIGIYGVYNNQSVEHIQGNIYLAFLLIGSPLYIFLNLLFLRKHPEAPFNNIFDKEIVSRITGFFILYLFLLIMVFTLDHIPTLNFSMGFLFILFFFVITLFTLHQLIRKFENKNPQPDSVGAFIMASANDARAVQIVHIDIPFYTLGFKNKEFFDEFCTLNKNVSYAIENRLPEPEQSETIE